jgi:2-polyprenyl-3-methyl-5-hydroxy-6-metoxy-1,4-benzoquinol methylase
MSPQKSVDYYNNFAKYYREYSDQKRDYLESVDAYIISGLQKLKAKTLLDIGSGDGIRAVNIAIRSGIEELSLVEPSSAMIDLSKSVEVPSGLKVNYYQVSAEELSMNRKFDAVTCLWNVLGHVPDKTSRINVLCRMGEKLTEGGSIFFDINNRYNIRAYGFRLVGRDVLRDLFIPKDENGDISFLHKINGKEIQGSGHLFSLPEIKYIIDKAGLRIVRRLVLDYKTGQQRRSHFEGQLLFELKKK